MKKLLVLILSSSLFPSIQAYEGKHLIHCPSEKLPLSLYFKIAGDYPNVIDSVATVEVLDFGDWSSDPVKTYSATNVKIDEFIFINVNSNNQSFSNLSLNLGRSGVISLDFDTSTGKYNFKYNGLDRVLGSIEENISCDYQHSANSIPRPGMSGGSGGR